MPFSERLYSTLGGIWGYLVRMMRPSASISFSWVLRVRKVMVLGNLLGEGDLEFAAEVKCQVKPEYVMYGGLKEMTGKENEIVNRLRIRQAGAEELAQSSGLILDWIKEKEIKYLAIHLDLDVLDPGLFRSLLFANPDGEKIDSSQGSMTLGQIGRVIQDVSEAADVVGLSFAEYLPWDAINMREFLTKLPVFH